MARRMRSFEKQVTGGQNVKGEVKMKRIIAVSLSMLFCVSLAACSSLSGKLEEIRQKGELVVYTDANFPPFEFKGGEDGVQGVDIEIAKAVAEELGVTAKFTNTAFEDILTAIKEGNGDIAISGITIDDERRESVDFSTPYIKSVQYLILPERSDIAVMEDLAGKRVCVAQNYTGQFIMEDEIGAEGMLYNQGTTLLVHNSAADAALDVIAGKADAVVMDEYVAKNIADTQTGLVAIELRYRTGDLPSEEYGVAVPKGNADLLKTVNKVIDELVAQGRISGWVVEFSQVETE
jgi:polar amino acid transport system substrate-binding protein